MICSLQWSLAALLVVLLPHMALGTAQTPDRLIYRGDTLLLHSNPLEQWLDELPQRPPELKGVGTNCWRGYEAMWQLENDQLYLVAVQPCGGKAISPAVLHQWFPFDAPHRIVASWVTGQLDVVLGKLLHYEPMGYASIYEKDWLLRFGQGKLVGQQTFDNRGCQVFPSSAGKEFQKQLYQAINWRKVPKQGAQVPRRVFIQFQPDSTGRNCRVVLVKGTGMPYDSLAMTAARAVAAATEWGACYRFGRWQQWDWTAPIVFDQANRRR
ncbi:hypothetical protein I2I05_10330 [Hymenobacter sp. BT683]|uniref:TonB C-terminal domain-containing protein n=1 Tax=Hymenobacter jeongseonensis TaxID=2791027 RepID=A0ABS0IHH6_9BACT|nr:hypothetical protein [Hymenobacter jeongseonensis]MBF9237791.1 hypothetical protein [Hymenobacter jeongseonensis]